MTPDQCAAHVSNGRFKPVRNGVAMELQPLRKPNLSGFNELSLRVPSSLQQSAVQNGKAMMQEASKGLNAFQKNLPGPAELAAGLNRAMVANTNKPASGFPRLAVAP